MKERGEREPGQNGRPRLMSPLTTFQPHPTSASPGRNPRAGRGSRRCPNVRSERVIGCDSLGFFWSHRRSQHFNLAPICGMTAGRRCCEANKPLGGYISMPNIPMKVEKWTTSVAEFRKCIIEERRQARQVFRALLEGAASGDVRRAPGPRKNRHQSLRRYATRLDPARIQLD
jgi:hypothetical protein